MAYTQRTKKYTDYSYLETNPASEDAVRAQMDGVVDEIFEIFENEAAEKSEVGLLANLLTTVKTSIVNAINELVGKIGNLSSLLTTDKSSLVNAINEVRTENRTTPTETVITTGFASGWSGSIRIRKNQEGLKTIQCDFTKTTDIILGDTPYTLAVDYRPISISAIIQAFAFANDGSVINGALNSGFVDTNGNITFIPTGSVTANVRRTRFTLSYY